MKVKEYKRTIKKVLSLLFFILFLTTSISATTWYFWRYRTHDNDCTSLTNAQDEDLCYQKDEQDLYVYDNEKWKPISPIGCIDASVYSDLNEAIGDIGSTKKTLIISKDISVSADLTVPENIILRFTYPAKITVPNGVTLTINGRIDAGLWQIFSGDGTVTGSPKIEAVYPEWFGAEGDGATDDSEAIETAIDFCPVGGKIVFSNKIYYHTGITLDKALSFVSNGLVASWPQNETSPPLTKGAILKGGTITIDGGSSSTKLYKCGLIGLTIYHTGASSYAVNIQNAIFTLVRDCKIYSESGYGCIHTIADAWQTVVDNCYLLAEANNAIALNAEQIVVVKGLTKIHAGGIGAVGCKVSGAGAASSFYNLDCYGKAISFYLYNTHKKFTCRLYGCRFERRPGDGGTALKIEGNTEFPRLIMYGGEIISADTGIKLAHAQGCRFLDVYIGISTGGTKATIDNHCYGIVFDNCYPIVENDASVTDNGRYTEYISAAYFPYTHNVSKIEVDILTNSNIVTFADGDTTPSVANSNIFRTNNSSTTSITTFEDGTTGQKITVIFGDSNTTIVHGSGIYLRNGADVIPSANTTMSFVYDGSNWYEE